MKDQESQVDQEDQAVQPHWLRQNRRSIKYEYYNLSSIIFCHSFKSRRDAHAGWVCRLRLLAGRHLEVLVAQAALEDPGAHHIQTLVSRVVPEVQGAPQWTLLLDPGRNKDKD